MKANNSDFPIGACAPKSRRIPDPHSQPTMTVPEAGALFGLSRTAAYRAARAGSIPTIPMGERMLVPTAAVRRLLYLEELEGDLNFPNGGSGTHTSATPAVGGTASPRRPSSKSSLGSGGEAKTSTWMDLRQAAVETQLSERMIRNKIADGTLPAYRAGRALRIKRADLDLLFTKGPGA